MKSLSTTLHAPVNSGTYYLAQNDAIIHSIIELLGGTVSEEESLDAQARILFDKIQEYDLLNAIHDQMIKLGYHPNVESKYEYVTADTDVPTSLVALPALVLENVDPLFGKPFPQLSLEGFVDMANKNGQDIGRSRLVTLLNDWNSMQKPAILGKMYYPNTILRKEELYYLLDVYKLTYDHTKGYQFDFTFGKGPKTTFPLTQLADELHVGPLDIIEAGKTFGYDLRPESEVTEYEANAIRAYAKRNWRD